MAENNFSDYVPPEIFELGDVEDLTFGPLPLAPLMDFHTAYHNPTPIPC